MAKLEVGGHIFLRIPVLWYMNTPIYTKDFGHAFLRFTDDSGAMFVIRAGVSPFNPPLNIEIALEINRPWEVSVDNPDNTIYDGKEKFTNYYSEVPIPAGQNAEQMWSVMAEAAESIRASGANYLLLWQNCIATVISSLNSVGIDGRSHVAAVQRQSGGSYPNFDGIIDVPYTLGASLLPTRSDDVLHGHSKSDWFLGSLGNDEIWGYSVKGPTNDEDVVDYRGLEGALRISLDMSSEGSSDVISVDKVQAGGGQDPPPFSGKSDCWRWR